MQRRSLRLSDCDSASLTTNPFSASRSPAPSRRASDSVPYLRSASVIPATEPGTPDARGPTTLRVVSVAALLHVHVARARGRRHLAIVERHGAAVGQPDDHEPAAADVARLGVGDREREADGDGGVDGVATLS